MMRIGLAVIVSGAAFCVGSWSSFVQADNFEEGARLQGLQVEIEWYERRISGLRSEISRFEFEAQTQEDRGEEGMQASGEGAEDNGVAIDSERGES